MAQALTTQTLSTVEPVTEALTGAACADDGATSLKAWSRLLRAHANAKRLLSAELKAAHGLTINDYEALVVLAHAEEGRLKRVELARRLMLTPSGVTRLLEGLEGAGLVERATCPSDLRVTYAQITEAGRATFELAALEHERGVRALFEGHLSEAELETLAAALEKLPGVAGHEGACPAAD